MSQPKKREIRARGEDAGPILLVPELCTRTGEGLEGESLASYPSSYGGNKPGYKTMESPDLNTHVLVYLDPK